MSLDHLLRNAGLASEAMRDSSFVDRPISITRPERDRLAGKVKIGRARTGGTSGGSLSRLFDQRAPRQGVGASEKGGVGAGFDQRQRAVVKVHYFNHAGGGAAGLKAHARYVARDAATRDDESNLAQGPSETASETGLDAERQAKAHAHYLARGDGGLFYDAAADGVDGAARAEGWAKSDKRHFRVILSAENAGKLNDLPSYTREVMARAGAAIGTQLQWIAIDHHDTDNPHTHIIIRGRRGNGQDLVIPKDFVKHGFRDVARDAATEWIGPRSRADERLALDREVSKHAPTRLDRMIAAQLSEDRTVRIAWLESPNGDPHTTLALKARARELQRMGLAREVKRNTLAFEPEWRDQLEAMELHLDIRKRLIQERAAQHQDRQIAKSRKGVDLAR